jgi:hypothetical protein
MDRARRRRARGGRLWSAGDAPRRHRAARAQVVAKDPGEGKGKLGRILQSCWKSSRSIAMRSLSRAARTDAERGRRQQGQLASAARAELAHSTVLSRRGRPRAGPLARRTRVAGSLPRTRVTRGEMDHNAPAASVARIAVGRSANIGTPARNSSVLRRCGIRAAVWEGPGRFARAGAGRRRRRRRARGTSQGRARQRWCPGHVVVRSNRPMSREPTPAAPSTRGEVHATTTRPPPRRARAFDEGTRSRHRRRSTCRATEFSPVAVRSSHRAKRCGTAEVGQGDPGADPEQDGPGIPLARTRAWSRPAAPARARPPPIRVHRSRADSDARSARPPLAGPATAAATNGPA